MATKATGNPALPVPRHVLPRTAKANGIQEIWAPVDGGDAGDSRDILGYIAGYLTFKWLAKVRCDDCAEIVQGDTESNFFLDCKDFRPNALTRPRKEIVDALLSAEKVFVAGGASLLRTPGVVRALLQRTQGMRFPESPCHPELRDFLFTHIILHDIFEC